MSAPAATGANVNISRDVPQWTGDYRRYDLVKEFLAALAAMTLLTVVLAVVFGSPDKPSISLAEWANNDPNDFVVTAVAELDGTSGTATYGAPYTDDPSAGQKLGPLPLQRWGGVREPVDTAQDFVLGPLSTVTGDAALSSALSQYTARRRTSARRGPARTPTRWTRPTTTTRPRSPPVTTGRCR